MIHEKVTEFINENIFNSKSFDNLSEEDKLTAINNAEKVLYLFFKAYNPNKRPVPIEAIAFQTLWEIDKVGVRDSDLGVASQSIEGMTQTFRGMDRTISPEVKGLLRNRVGSYHLPVSNTNRHMNLGY